MAAPPTAFRSPWMLALASGIVALVAFLPTLGNGPVWDDHHLIVANPYFESWAKVADLFRHDIWTTTKLGVRSEFYRPLPMLSFALDHLVGRGSVAVFHFGNALIHALSVTILALTLHLTLRGRSVLLPVVFALAWGLAPITTEPVAWISGRFDLLATLFLMLALYANAGTSRLRTLLVVLAIAASLLCKEAAILGPLALALADLLLLGRRPREVWLKYAALALVVFANFALRDAVGVITAQARPDLVELARSYAFMWTSVLGETFAPTRLDAFRPYVAPSLPVTAIVLGLASLVSLALAERSLRASEPSRSRYRVALFGWLWFGLILAPSALTGPALDMTGDRYAYLPTIGLAFFFAALGLELQDRLEPRLGGRRLASLGAALALFVLSTEALSGSRRLSDWRDDRALIESSLRAHPGNPYALYALGEREVLAGNRERGDALLRTAIATGPRPWRALTALCYSLLQQNLLDEASQRCQESIAINGRDPRSWINLASIRVKQRRWREGLDYARRGGQYRARYAEAHYLAAISLANLGAIEEARGELREALRIEPDHRASRSLARQFEKKGVAPAAEMHAHD